jgi:hypothetical protein
MNRHSITRGVASAMGFCVLLVGTSFAGITEGFAADPAVQAATMESQEDGSRRVCRILTPSGSRLTRRVCRTQAEWNRSSDRTADGVLKHQMNESTQYQRGSGPM